MAEKLDIEFDEDAQILPNRRPRKLRNTLKNTGALVVTTAALAAAGIGSANAANESSPQKVETGGLPRLESLPGKNLKVGPEKLQQLSDSTVKLLRLGQDGKYDQFCSGVKVVYKGVVYVLSASHCFKDIHGFDKGVIDRQTDPNIPNVPSANIITADQQGTLFIGQGESNPTANNQAIASITGVSVMLDGSVDLALAAVEVGKGQEDPNAKSSIFDMIPAVPLEDFAQTSSLPGQEIVQVGFPEPELANGKVVKMVGRLVGYLTPNNEYIGNMPDFAKATLAITALDSSQLGVNPGECLPGASGSAAETASGKYFFGLSRYYLRAKSKIAKKFPEIFNGFTLNDHWWNMMERSLGVKLPDNYDLLCGYTIPSKNTFDKQVAGLNRVFDFKEMHKTEEIKQVKQESAKRTKIEASSLKNYQNDKYRQERIEPLVNELQINGDDNFIKQTKDALRLIGIFDFEELQNIVDNTDHIDLISGFVSVVKNDLITPGHGGGGIDERTVNQGSLTYAGSIVQAAEHNIVEQVYNQLRLRHQHFTQDDFNKAIINTSNARKQFLSSAGATYIVDLDQ